MPTNQTTSVRFRGGYYIKKRWRQIIPDQGFVSKAVGWIGCEGGGCKKLVLLTTSFLSDISQLFIGLLSIIAYDHMKVKLHSIFYRMVKTTSFYLFPITHESGNKVCMFPEELKTRPRVVQHCAMHPTLCYAMPCYKSLPLSLLSIFLR